MKKSGAWILIAFFVCLITSLVVVQYKYSKKTDNVENLVYKGAISRGSYSDMLIFSYEDRLVGFEDRKNNLRWLTEGEEYNIEYNDAKWHRSVVLFVSFEKS